MKGQKMAKYNFKEKVSQLEKEQQNLQRIRSLAE